MATGGSRSGRARPPVDWLGVPLMRGENRRLRRASSSRATPRQARYSEDGPRPPHLRVPARGRRPRPAARRRPPCARARAALPYPGRDRALRHLHLPGRRLPLRERRRRLHHRLQPRGAGRPGDFVAARPPGLPRGRHASAAWPGSAARAVPARYEFKIVRNDGEERWLDFSASSVIDVRGRPAVLGTAFDITERKQRRGADQAPRLSRHADRACPTGCSSTTACRVAVAQAHRQQQPAGACSSSTSTASRSSTTRSATASATGCCRRWPSGCEAARARGRHRGRAWAATSSSCSCPRIARRTTPAKVAEKILDVAAAPVPPGRARALRDAPAMGVSLYPDDGPRRQRRCVKNADTAHVPGQGAGPRQLPALHARP